MGTRLLCSCWLTKVPASRQETNLAGPRCTGLPRIDTKRVAQLLIDKGADIEAKDNSSRMPLHLAAESGDEAIVQLLIDKRAKINEVDNTRPDAAALCRQEGHETTIWRLLDKDAEIGAKDNDWKTPLHYAAEKGHEVIARRLLDMRAVIEVVDNNGRTPRYYAAAMSGHENIMQWLMDKVPSSRQRKQRLDATRTMPLQQGSRDEKAAAGR